MFLMKKYAIFLISLLSLVIFSCEKEVDDIVGTDPAPNLQGALKPVYAVAGGIGVYTSNSPSSVTLSGPYGSYVGGIIRARALMQSSNSGPSFIIEISKQDGTPFAIGGEAVVRAGSVGGGYCNTNGPTYYSVGQSTVTVVINATFTQGLTHFYPLFLSSNGQRFFAEPIVIYTIPSYFTGPYSAGTILGTVDGVTLYAASNSLQCSTCTYQCTEFCRRYYGTVYGLSVGGSGWGNANTWYANGTGVQKIQNGAGAPRVGDILCLGGGTSGLGHVGIITEVSATQIKMANQNGGSGTMYPIGWTLTRQGNNIVSPTGYSVLGWLRK